ncbi:cupin domain-containing protein [Dyella flagellata]|uniref:ChrR-like cupin domain-containing protein n=1 Tax=Dyella flagellata TaxID=1867833 RepID=A0ABQ5X837_9GAMM|nr:cupin domain-containing protein [Dyella flagellata]GLQ87753.1 hypothetical protein GCM10007898_13210 [Dyella flagellata]
MLINADFSRRATVTPDQYQWVASPQVGVERVMLDRLGGEKVRSTSIVRYAPQSTFPRHQHPGGEEILVLSGTFSDEAAHYPAGWYLRNPPGSSHHPFSDQGAIIFVKLGQMPADKNHRVRIDTHDPRCWQRWADRDVCPLFADDSEQVSLQRLDPGMALFANPVERAEVLVVAGEVLADTRACPRGSWLRCPAGNYPGMLAGAQGATFYLKTGRLGRAPVPV